MAVAAASAALGFNGHVGYAAIGYAAAIVLAVANKVRMSRRGRDRGAVAAGPKPWRLIGYIAIGALSGLLFFPVLAALMIGGLGERPASIATACGAGVLFAVVYFGSVIARRRRQKGH